MIDLQPEMIVLVDANDQQLGLAEKMEVHRRGLLHRAFSVFIFNEQGEWLLQRRAMQKYHSRGLWTNACCSHPMDGESVLTAGRRRLMEEMGIDCELKSIFTFTYRAELDQDMIEYELDHVLIGTTNSIPTADSDEVMDWKFVDPVELLHEIALYPDAYTHWFKIALPKVCAHLHIINNGR